MKGSVTLRKGDIIPARCQCGKLYTPPLDSERSQCPACRRWNAHAGQDWQQVPDGGMDAA